MNGSHGNDANDGLSWKTAKLTIANATGTVSDGGTVNIANGVYRWSGNTNIIINKSMTIKGQSKSGTIINGSNSGQIFKIKNTPSEYMGNINVIIQDLTIANGNMTNDGTISNKNGILTIKNVIFKGNERTITNDGDLAVISSTFTHNTASGGGAILNSGTCTVTGSIFTYNTATTYGGAISNRGILTATNNNFIGNTAGYEGNAIYNIGNLTAHFNRFVDYYTENGKTYYVNEGIGIGVVYSTDGIVDAELNWWGDNKDPNNRKIGGFTINKWFVLKINTNSSSVPINTNSKITADLRYDNYGTLHTESYLPNGIPVTFTTNLGTISTKAYTVNGIAQATLKSALGGSANVSAIVDSQQVSKLVKVIDKVPPKISSTYPKKNVSGISRTSTIYIKFNENIKASTYWSKIYVKNMKTGKKAVISKSIKGNTLYIKMSSKRYAYTWYQIYIPKAAVKDSFNNNLSAYYTFKFKTGKYPLNYQ